MVESGHVASLQAETLNGKESLRIALRFSILHHSADFDGHLSYCEWKRDVPCCTVLQKINILITPFLRAEEKLSGKKVIAWLLWAKRLDRIQCRDDFIWVATTNGITTTECHLFFSRHT
jgi:hypothetical protein